MDKIHPVSLPGEDNSYLVASNNFDLISDRAIFTSKNLESVIVVTEEVYSSLEKSKEIAKITNREVNFLLFGETRYNGIIWLDNIVLSVVDSNIKERSLYEMDEHITHLIASYNHGDYEYSSSKPVICIGSTTDDFYLNHFSSVTEVLSNYHIFAEEKIEILGLSVVKSNNSFIGYKHNKENKTSQKFSKLYVAYSNSDNNYGIVKILKR